MICLDSAQTALLRSPEMRSPQALVWSSGTPVPRAGWRLRHEGTYILHSQHVQVELGSNLADDAAAGRERALCIRRHRPVPGVLEQHVRAAVAGGFQIDEGADAGGPLAALRKAVRRLQTVCTVSAESNVRICRGQRRQLPVDSRLKAPLRGAHLLLCASFAQSRAAPASASSLFWSHLWGT